ncbi:MAG TPA: TIGR03000 domain-containing protein [Gemmataceae bacterium]|nr:TIGR03000 domain-containing protein [Gemmataceae bacterium]
MNRPSRPWPSALLAVLALLILAASAPAQPGMRRAPAYPSGRMPGWDWWRIYPWSPYNYGRNPYNPIRYPYVGPYPYGYGPSSDYDEPRWGASDSELPVVVPHPSGALRVAPPDAAVIRLYIPDRFGEVSFDGVKSSSIGTTRYYVTPDLEKEKNWQYEVKARFKKDGQTVTEERTVKVSPGKTVQVDFR